MNEANQYSAAEALRVLLDRVRQKNESLANRMQQAINAGKDVREEEQALARGRGRKRKRQYRKHVPLSDEEALHVAFEVLRVHFYVFPLVVNSVNVEFTVVPVAAKRVLVKADSEKVEWQYGPAPVATLEAHPKDIEVEIETEVTQIRRQSSNYLLKPYRDADVAEMKALLDALRELIE